MTPPGTPLSAEEPGFGHARTLRGLTIGVTAAVMLLATPAAMAADLDGRALGIGWGLPFAGLLLSIALLPLFAPSLWHHHFGKITAAWTLALLVPLAGVVGAGGIGSLVLHTLLAEYLPFGLLLLALFTTAGAFTSGATCAAAPSATPRSWPAGRCWPASWARPAPRCC